MNGLPVGDWRGEGSVLDYIVSSNLERRHLNQSQRSAFAAEALPLYEAEAKQREVTSTGGANPQRRASLPDPEKGRARDHAAKVFHTSGIELAHPLAMRNAVEGGQTGADRFADNVRGAVRFGKTMRSKPNEKRKSIPGKRPWLSSAQAG